MASRTVDLLITYRVIKLLVTPWKKFDAYKFGIIDDKGKQLKKMRHLIGNEKSAYTILHRFVFNLKRIMKRVGLGGKLGSFAVALALLIKEDKNYNIISRTTKFNEIISKYGLIPIASFTSVKLN